MDTYKHLKLLIEYIESEQFRGYDPYDILNTPIPLNWFGNYFSAVSTQLHKRNPVNIRLLLGIKKEHNPKGMGIMLKAYTRLYRITGDERYLDKSKYLFNWLYNNYSKGYAGKCWGYNFDWASSGGYIKANTPSVVVTSFVIDGIYEYYLVTKDQLARDSILSSADYIDTDIPKTRLRGGISFSYTHQSNGVCYNASLLAAEILAKSDFISNSNCYTDQIDQSVRFVLSRQKEDGSWLYSYDPARGTERRQIDFHQGFILISLQNIIDITGSDEKQITDSIERGLKFYYENQFLPGGRSLWRLPSRWPVDIHNQSQGIITFSRLERYNAGYRKFAHEIAEWTVNHMQDEKGYFYYRFYPGFKNRISYMRWSQAWMMLALTELLDEN